MSNYDQQLELLLMPLGLATSSVTVFSSSVTYQQPSD